MTDFDKEALTLATMFHDTYERLAPKFTYVTREDTRHFEMKSPNGKLMVAVCKELIPTIRDLVLQVSAEPVAWMIEHRNTHMWYRGLHKEDRFGWTSDPNRAIRFLTKDDAELAMRAFELFDSLHFATEHRWVSKRETQSTVNPIAHLYFSGGTQRLRISEIEPRERGAFPVFTRANLQPEQLAELERLRHTGKYWEWEYTKLEERSRERIAGLKEELTQLRAENAALKENR